MACIGPSPTSRCARYIVDSSKRPAPAALLSRLRGLESFFIHLIRDPRAEAFSWTRTRPFPGEPGGELQRISTLKAARAWVAFNALAEVVRRGHPSVFLRYEDLVARPTSITRNLLRRVGVDDLPLPFVDPCSVMLHSNHGIGGNPTKFVNGIVRIRPDDEWIEAQRVFDRAVATIVAAPLLARYRYPLRVPRSRGGTMA